MDDRYKIRMGLYNANRKKNSSRFTIHLVFGNRGMRQHRAGSDINGSFNHHAASQSHGISRAISDLLRHGVRSGIINLPMEEEQHIS